ncbi:MAG: P1 family peptidase [Sutterella wadsworthensis]
MVVATDARLMPALERRQAPLNGPRWAGGIASNGSGDFAIAFSTAKENRVPHNTKKLEKLQNVNVANDDMTPIFMATIEATEEAVVNSLFKAKDVKGYNGKVTKALPVDQVLEMLKAEGKIVKQPR